MNANEMKHAASLEEWKQRIMECRASGLPVRMWCAQHAYNTSTYYRWERELFGRFKKPPAETDLVARSELLPAAKKQELVEIPVVEETAPVISGSGFRPVVIVRVGGTELSLTNGVSPKLMKYLDLLLRWKNRFRPKHEDEQPDERYIEACRILEPIDYMPYAKNTMSHHLKESGDAYNIADTNKLMNEEGRRARGFEGIGVLIKPDGTPLPFYDDN